jgi:hypothetical protein
MIFDRRICKIEKSRHGATIKNRHTLHRVNHSIAFDLARPDVLPKEADRLLDELVLVVARRDDRDVRPREPSGRPGGSCGVSIVHGQPDLPGVQVAG